MKLADLRFALRRGLPRMWRWDVIAAALLLLLWWLAPQNLDVVVNKLALVTLAAVLGTRIDRGIFPYARPDQVPEPQSGLAGLRRAIIVAAIVVGVTLGL